jgi:isopenicillin N synthase-like dioxygenase
MTTAALDESGVGAIRVIDIGPVLQDRPDPGVSLQLLTASQDPGFIYIRNHGIPDEVIDNARATALRFFGLGAEQKSSVTVSEHHRGWLSPGAAKMDDDVQPDRKESFIWGDDSSAALDDHSLRGPNLWPDATVPSLRNDALGWYGHAERLSIQLMRAMAAALDIDLNHFVSRYDRPLSRASFVFYPPQPAQADGFGAGPHTDFGTMTVLCQDDVGGLEIETPEGNWVQAPPIEGTLIVNVGDLLERWTNGAFRSAPHRVINRGARERLSLVFAFDPNPETVVDARSVYRSKTEEHAGYAPAISCGEYLDWRFAKAFSYRADSDANS